MKNITLKPAMNPIMKKELRVSARTFRLLLAMMLYTALLTVIATGIMGSAQGTVNYGYGNIYEYTSVRYNTFTASLTSLAYSQLAMVCLIMPILTAGSISAEREKQTLDIMLTTPIAPFSIMIGKLGASMVKLFMFLICSLPAMSICYLYGGIDWYTLISIYAGIMIIAFTIGAIGIWCSTIFQKTVISIIVTLVLETALFLLPIIIPLVWLFEEQAKLMAAEAASTVVAAGYMPILLVFCPIIAFIEVILSSTGTSSLTRVLLVTGIDDVYTTAGGMAIIQKIWIPLSAIIAILIGLLFLKLAANRIDSHRRHNSRLNKKMNH